MIDIITVQQVLVTAAWCVPIVVALTQLVKTTLDISSRFAPIVSVALGLGVSFLVGDVTPVTALVGIIFGLTASGLYDVGAKTIVNA